MPRALLKADYAALEAWARATPQPVRELSLNERDELSLTLQYSQGDDECACRLVAQLDGERYPTAAVAVREAAGDGAGGSSAEGASVGEFLELINASLSDGARLSGVIETLAAVLGAEVSGLDEMLAAAAPPASGADELGDEAEFEMEEANEFAMNQGKATDEALLMLERQWQRKCAADDAAASASAEDEGRGADTPASASLQRQRRSRAALPEALRLLFTSAESSKILINELKQLVRDNMIGHTDLTVHAPHEDVHVWRVQLHDVCANSRLGKALRGAAAARGGGAPPPPLELELEFTPGLHPMYPPWLRLLSPRLSAHAAEAVMAAALFTPEGWDPLLAIKAAVRHAQGLLEAHATLAHDDASGAYTRAEHVCCRLEALSALSVRARWAYASEQGTAQQGDSGGGGGACAAGGGACAEAETARELYAACHAVSREEEARLRGLRRDSGGAAGGAAGRGGGGGGSGGNGKSTTRSEHERGPSRQPWAAGVGYGTGRTSKGSQWDAAAAEAAQQQRDAETRVLVDELAHCCARGELGRTLASDSCLLPFLEQSLRGASFNDLQARTALFGSLLSLVKEMAARPELRALLFAPAAQPPGPADAAAAPEAAAAPAAEPAPEPAAPEPPSAKRARTAAPRASRASSRAATRAAAAAAAPTTASPPGGGAQPAAPPPAAPAAPSAARRAPDARSVAAGVHEAALNAHVYLTLHAQQHGGADGAGGAGAGGAAAPAARGKAAALPPPPQDSAALLAVARQFVAVAALLGVGGSAPAWRGAAQHAAARGGGGDAGSSSAPAAAPGSTAAAAAVRRAGAKGSRSARCAAAASSAATVSGSGGSKSSVPAREYCEALSELQFDMVSAPFRTHRLTCSDGADGSGRGAGSAKRTKRIMVECPDLRSSLPLNASSSVFVRVEQARTHLWKALITGPDDTPYAGGCFAFDLLLPTDYPSAPPKVVLTTTGGGAVRFNPNLYADGKVCLSLLGTWHGDHGESWHADRSTVLQVLMSIQALILVPDPYFNEPGLEMERGTPNGDRQSAAYNVQIREYTLRHAVLGMLRAPPPEFADVVRAHFSLKRAALLDQCDRWVGAATSALQRQMAKLRDEIAAELDKLH